MSEDWPNTKLFLIEITGGIVEIAAVNKSHADDIFDSLISPMAGRGTLSFIGPRTEDEYEERQSELQAKHRADLERLREACAAVALKRGSEFEYWAAAEAVRAIDIDALLEGGEG